MRPTKDIIEDAIEALQILRKRYNDASALPIEEELKLLYEEVRYCE